jgi:putative ABC transport system permease protein
MIRNYITIALRSMMRNKAYTIINVVGLSVGVACCLMLALYIQDEMGYDRHHKDLYDLYRMTTHFQKSDGVTDMATTSAPIAWGIKDEVPEIETVTRLVNPPGVSQNLIRYEDKQFYESDGYIADSTLFDIFNYEFRAGDPKKALVDANSAVITEELAEKLFGTEPALDKTIFISQGGPSANFKITGVLKSPRKKSHIHATFFVSMASDGWATYLRSKDVMDEWGGQNFLLSYVKLKPGARKDAAVANMNKVFLKYGAEDAKALGMKKNLGLEPVKDIYLYSSYHGQSARIKYIYVVASIAIFILIIACINFMNLSTAKATKRAGEVGLRKTLGAQRGSLIRQFLGEAMVIVLIAIVLSVGIIQIALPYFNSLTSKNITFQTENLLQFALMIVGIALFTGVIAGSYPAFYLSSFQPAKVLKGKLMLNNSNSLLRRSLVVFQFVIAISLVCGMLVISRQLHYMQEKDLGFNTASRIVIPIRTETAGKNYQVFENEAAQISSVEKVTGADYVPGSPIWGDGTFYRKGGSMDNGVLIHRNTVEPNYLDVMNIKLLAGRNFGVNYKTESKNKIIVNKITATKLGFTDPSLIVGQELYTEWHGEKRAYEVIGVMDDFHQTSLKEQLYPILLWLPDDSSELPNIIVKARGGNFSNTIAALQDAWVKVNPDTPFEFSFLDEFVKKQYDDDRKISSVITSFSVIAMIISCLGLYGLSTYMAERRFKEIGVRKVMGATVTQVVQMMTGEFIKLVIIAFLISVPLAWYAISKWLNGFAYKTPVEVYTFAIAGASALMIAIVTVSFESIRAASGNPVNALRNE